MNELGDTIAWPTRDPGWMSKVVITGLISLIPIIGWLVLVGWMLACLDNLRAGRQELPPAGFGYMGRGVNLFVVLLLYGILLAVVLIACFIVGAILAATGSSADSSGPLAPIGALFFFLGYALAILGGLALYFLLPVIVLETERGGVGGGMNVPAVVAIARRNGSATLMAGLMTLLAYIIGSLGSFLCGIGYFLTVAYGYAMAAGVIRVYEQQVGLSPAALQPPSPPPFPPATPA